MGLRNSLKAEIETLGAYLDISLPYSFYQSHPDKKDYHINVMDPFCQKLSHIRLVHMKPNA